MVIKSISFVGSFPSENKSPKTQIPEYAFIGRSNVGKSSLINMLMQRKGLAKVSSTPGKTQMINFFEVNESWHLVDLPGYGYAKISKKQRASLEKMINTYLQTREQLQCAFVLIDSRIPLQENDREFINWLGETHIPFVLVYTKIDSVKKSQQHQNIKDIEQKLLEEWTELPQTFITSAVNQQGREEVLHFISELNTTLSKN